MEMSASHEYTLKYKDIDEEEVNYIKRPGLVQIVYPNGDTFEGNIGPDKTKEGHGKYEWKTQTEEGKEKILATFEGSYSNGAKNGLGKMTFPNGDVYHGQWTDDRIHGEGSYVYANGDIYSGSFEQGLRNGHGTYEFLSDQSLLQGNYSQNKFIDGKWIFKDGSHLNCQFKDGKPMGSCTFRFANGLEQDVQYVDEMETNAAELETTAHRYIPGGIRLSA